jgi:hypothetical protein
LAKDYLEETQPQVMAVQKGINPVLDTQGAIIKVAENNSKIAQKLPPKSGSSDEIMEAAKRYVAEENTEKLAEMILDGHGEKLLGLHSTNPYVQGLLENVPDYIVSSIFCENKINAHSHSPILLYRLRLAKCMKLQRLGTCQRCRKRWRDANLSPRGTRTVPPQCTKLFCTNN